MLKTLRKKGVAKKILWVIAVIIIFSFGIFGTANYLNNPSPIQDAGKIFGKKISEDKFQEAYQRTRLQAFLRYGENFHKISPFLNLEAETWDRLILLHEVERSRIKVSNEEVVKAIEAMPYFQRDGQFDSLLYNDILRYLFEISAKDFEEAIRESLKLDKLFSEVTAWVKVPEEEIFEAYKNKNEKVQVSYVLFPTEKFKDQAALDETKVQGYYDEHKSEFLIPESINVEYLQLELPEGIEEAKKTELASQANTIFEELKTNADFAAVAQKHHLSVQSTGFFSREQPNLKIGWSYQLLEKSFKLSVGEISPPMETPQGYYILRLKEKKDAYTADLEEALPKIREAILLEGAKTIAAEQAQKQFSLLSENLAQHHGNFSAAVKTLNLEAQQTPIFSRGEYLPQIGISKVFQETAFGLTQENPLSGVIEWTKGFAILHLDTSISVEEEQFAKDKESFEKELLTERKNAALNDYLTTLRLKANLQDYLPRQEKPQAN